MTYEPASLILLPMKTTTKTQAKQAAMKAMGDEAQRLFDVWQDAIISPTATKAEMLAAQDAYFAFMARAA